MIVFLIELWIAAAHGPLPEGLVGLHADNRFDLSVTAGAEELDDAVHGTVVGQGKRFVSQTGGLVDEIVDAAQPVEEGVLGMGVEMDKIVGHRRVGRSGR